MEGLELSKEEINEIFDKNQLHLQTSPNGLHSSFCKLDYISLQPQQLLRTEAINLISSMLYEKFIENCSAIGGIDDYRSYIRLLDVFLVTLIMSTQEEYILLTLKDLDLFSPQTRYLLLPVNTEPVNGSHWYFVAFENGLHPENKHGHRLIVFDSTYGISKSAQTLRDRLQVLFKMFHQSQVTMQLSEAIGIPKQSNNFDCGVYTIGYLQYLLLEAEDTLRTGQRDIHLDRLHDTRPYLLNCSNLARIRYRGMVTQLIKDTFAGKSMVP